MEQKENRMSSVVRTPSSAVLVQRRSKSKSYRQSYRSCLGAASRLCFTPGLTARRANTSWRTPRPRNIKEQLDPEHLALLTKSEWQLSYVTPLFQFRHTRLKSYSRQLSAFIAAERQQGVAVDVEGIHGFRVSFSVVQGLVEMEQDAEAVFIQIASKPMFSRPEDPEKTLWSGWFSCVHGNVEYLSSLSQDFVCLPLFCSCGPETLTSIVKSWFRRFFDCSFGPLELNHTTLQWLATLWTNCQPETDLQHLKMSWMIPVSPSLQITYTVDPQDAWDLWRSVRRPETGKGKEEEVIDMDEVEDFMTELKRHFYRHFRLDLSAGNLNQVATSLGSAKSSGRIKISNGRYIITTLSLLTECALLKMPI
ncbi:centromere protein L [Eucyclogobius newberryi]|uniref:centromere protein L n=1 Tax=Eucyclogobius newberryi TaxID=166745 RepID=UPI003B591DCF